MSVGDWLELGIHIGFTILVLICGVFVIRGYLGIRQKERERAAGGTFQQEQFPFNLLQYTVDDGVEKYIFSIGFFGFNLIFG